MLLKEEINFNFNKVKTKKNTKGKKLFIYISIILLLVPTIVYTKEHMQTVCALYDNGKSQCFVKKLDNSILWNWILDNK